MLYASDLFRHLNGVKVAIEDNPDDIPDLVAEFLVHAVERRLARNLCYGFRKKENILGRVRGRIDLFKNERHQLLLRGKVACRYEELTVNTPRNCYVRAALETIARLVRRPDLAHKCRMLAMTLRTLGVVGESPGRHTFLIDSFGYRDTDDRLVVAAAHLALNMALPTEQAGNRFLTAPSRDEIWVRRLYEKAVGGFYDVVLTQAGWRVGAGETINWQIEQKTDGIDKFLPTMRTDVVLTHCPTERRIVIDTKFTSILKPGWHRQETFHSGYVYQIYAYLRSQEDDADPLSAGAAGLLIHPSVGEMVDESVLIQGHTIRFATVDLAGTATEIREQLLRIVAGDEIARTSMLVDSPVWEMAVR
jgi:5-methylcytosine-specific restriction enzyme subunit McrC